jgi:putative Holliday junction resolvase
VAKSDPNGILATPLTTLRRDLRHGGDIAELVMLVRDHQAVGVVVGLPVTLAGREGQSAQLARQYGERLAQAVSPVPVAYVDERLSTVSATRKLHESSSALRGARAKRTVIDQAAAVERLQQWLELYSRTEPLA